MDKKARQLYANAVALDPLTASAFSLRNCLAFNDNDLGGTDNARLEGAVEDDEDFEDDDLDEDDDDDFDEEEEFESDDDFEDEEWEEVEDEEAEDEDDQEGDEEDWDEDESDWDYEDEDSNDEGGPKVDLQALIAASGTHAPLVSIQSAVPVAADRVRGRAVRPRHLHALAGLHTHRPGCDLWGLFGGQGRRGNAARLRPGNRVRCSVRPAHGSRGDPPAIRLPVGPMVGVAGVSRDGWGGAHRRHRGRLDGAASVGEVICASVSCCHYPGG
jgi:hypothetical protein